MLEIVPSNQFKKDLKLLSYFYSVPEHIQIYFNR